MPSSFFPCSFYCLASRLWIIKNEAANSSLYFLFPGFDRKFLIPLFLILRGRIRRKGKLIRNWMDVILWMSETPAGHRLSSFLLFLCNGGVLTRGVSLHHSYDYTSIFSASIHTHSPVLSLISTYYIISMRWGEDRMCVKTLRPLFSSHCMAPHKYKWIRDKRHNVGENKGKRWIHATHFCINFHWSTPKSSFIIIVMMWVLTLWKLYESHYLNPSFIIFFLSSFFWSHPGIINKET